MESLINIKSTKTKVLIDGLAGTICLLAIAWSMNLSRTFGVVIFVQQYMLIIFGIALSLVYLTLPFKRGGDRQEPQQISALDCLASIVSIVTCTILSLRYPVLSEDIFFHLEEGFYLSAIILALTIEGLRRAIGWPLVIIAGVFLIYGLLGQYIPGELQGRYVPYDEFFSYIVIDPNSLPGVPLVVGSTIVIIFVFFGQLLKYAGGSMFFTDLSIALMGSFRGGAAKISIVASSLFGAISGSAVSNVVSTGVITIPLMKKAGYSNQRAAAIEAVASTGGQLMPPVMGAAAFLMAEFIQVPYSEVVLAATIPALLYYFALFIQVDLDAASADMTPVDADERPKVWATLKSGWHFLLPFVVLIGALFSYNQSPDKAALYGAAVIALGGILLGYQGKRMHVKALWFSLRDTGKSVLDVLLIVATAGVVIGTLNVSGLSFSLTLTLSQMGGDNVFILLAVAAAIGVVLGMGMPTVGVYVLLATLVAPALVRAGVSPLAAHMFVLYFGMLSMITPPIALASFTAAGLANADPMRTGFQSIRYGWSAYIVPFAFVFTPELLMQGSTSGIALVFVRSAVAVWLISVGVGGFLSAPLSALLRVGMIVVGLIVLVGASVLPSLTLAINLVSLAIIVGVLIWLYFRR